MPLDIDKLYQNFLSHDYLGRRAMKCMLNYHLKRKAKLPLFEMNDNCSSFSALGNLIGKDTRSAHIWLQNMKQILKL